MSCRHCKHTVPSFPLVCKVWHLPNAPPNPRDFEARCQLIWGPGKIIGQSLGGSVPDHASRFLYLPAGTDIHCTTQALFGDIIECPASSGRFYEVVSVDDMAKGFRNEFRCIIMYPSRTYGDWRVPIP